jgi:2-amino-4-hydroxy-6-hydroxymethyldihydropteridine diphosphokinase
MAALVSHFCAVHASTVYRSRAVGFVGNDFLNLVARVVVDIEFQPLISALAEIERQAGRQRDGRGPGPRALDLDLLLYGSVVDGSRRLPHMDILRYPFVLCPLSELAPEQAHPLTGVAFARSWQSMQSSKSTLIKLGPWEQLDRFKRCPKPLATEC